MKYNKKSWSEDHKRFRTLLKKEQTFNDAIKLFMNLHESVHSSSLKKFSFENELWEDLSDKAFRVSQNKKGRTVAYGIWHSTRIEDITMNLLVTEDIQVIDKYSFQSKINSSIYDTGNALTSQDILNWSDIINIEELKKYRIAVANKTRDIITNLCYSDMSKKVPLEGLQKIIDIGAVVKDEDAIWLIDYWKTKTVAGILLMPCTRHHMVHLSESMDAKKRC